MEKITQIAQWLTDQNLDIACINNPANITYLVGFQSNPHERILMLFITKNQDVFLFAPDLEVTEAQQATGLEVYGYKDEESPWDKIANIIATKHWDVSSIAIEKNFLTVERYEALQAQFPEATFDGALTAHIQNLMVLKSDAEIAKMIEAGELADYALEVGYAALAEGVTETAVVAAVEAAVKQKGVTEMSFATTILFGDHAASPHGTSGDRKLQKGELVLFDLGVVWKGYVSDVTRTVAFGDITDEAKKVYDIVLEAHEQALAAVRPGITAGELDKIARDVITDAGYGEYFIHRLGHGLGSNVHEYPSIMAGSDVVIKQGMCFSIEPGIYIPGKVGVRIEDCLYVTATGAEVFTFTPKKLQTLATAK